MSHVDKEGVIGLALGIVFLAVFCLGIWAGSNPDILSTNTFGKDREHVVATSGISAEPHDAFWLAHDGDAASYEEICNQPIDHDQADLCQQWRTAERSSDISFYTKLQLLCSILGLFGLFWTIYLSRTSTIAAIAAARESGVAAKEAMNANIVARENGLNDRRPWLSLNPVPNEGGGITDEVLVPGLQFDILNIGKTPAVEAVSGHVVISQIASPYIKREMISLLNSLTLDIDKRDLNAAIMPNDNDFEFVHKTLPIDAAAAGVFPDGQKVASAVVIVGVAYRGPEDETIRTTAGAFSYVLRSDPTSDAPNRFRGFVQKLPGGSLVT